MAKFKKIGKNKYQTEYGIIKKMDTIVRGYNAGHGEVMYYTRTRWVADDYEFNTRKEAYEFLRDVANY